MEYKPAAELPDDEYPLVLTTGRSMFHYHTGSMTRRSGSLNVEVPTAFVQVNPEDAARLGIAGSAPVRLVTRRGSVEADARVTDEVPPGLVFLPFHFAESCANVLTNPALDPSCGMPEFKVCATRLEVRR